MFVLCPLYSMGRGMKRSWGLAGEFHPSKFGEVRKWEYAESACRDEFVTTPGRSMLSDPAFKDALAWEAALQPSELIRKREAMISKIEEADELMRSSGLCAAWFAVADAELRGVSAEANGELFQQLAAATEFVDAGAVPLLREGVPSLYRLPVSFIRCCSWAKVLQFPGCWTPLVWERRFHRRN